MIIESIAKENMLALAAAVHVSPLERFSDIHDRYIHQWQIICVLG